MSSGKIDLKLGARVRAFLRDGCAVETSRALGMREAAKLRDGDAKAADDAYEVVSPVFAFQKSGPAVGLTDKITQCCKETLCAGGTICVVAGKP